MPLWFIGFAVAATTPLTAPTKSPSEEEILQLDPFEVTGTLIKRAEVEGPAPVKTVTREDMELMGRASFSELLYDWPEASIASTHEYGDPATAPIRGASPFCARGFGSDTAVLVDGRRAVPTGTTYSRGHSFVDMNRYPTAMVERIEILQDCGALYGTNSVSGVINIILRKDYTGTEVTARYGNSFRTDVAEKSLSILTGASDRRSSFTLGFDYFQRGGLRAADTTFANNPDLTDRYRAKSPVYANLTFDLRSNISAQARLWPVAGQVNGVGGVNISGMSTGTRIVNLPGTGNRPDGTLPTATPNFTNPPQNGTGGQFQQGRAASFQPPNLVLHSNSPNFYNQQELAWLAPAAERSGFNASFRRTLSPHAAAYVRLAYQHNRSHIESAPTAIDAGIDNGIFVPRTNYWNPFGINVSFAYRPVDLGPRTFDTTIDSTSAIVGVRGIIAGRWAWDTGFSFGLDQVNETLGNLISESRLRASLAKSTLDALNIFGGAGYKNDPTTLDFIRTSAWLRGRSSLKLWDARVSGEAFSLPTGPVGVGFSAEVNRQNYSQVNDPIGAAQNDLIGISRMTEPTWAHRTVEAAATEVHVPIVKRGEYRWLHNSDLSAAARFDHYSEGYSSGLKPYVGLRVQPVPRLTLRASYAETFSAWSLQRLYGGPVDTYSTGLADLRRPPALTGDPFDGTTTSRLMRNQGNPHLAPWSARSRQAGFVYDLPSSWLKGLTVGVTWYHAEIDGAGAPYPDTAREIQNNELGTMSDMVVRDPGTETYTNSTNAPISILSGPNGKMTTVAVGQTVTVPGRIRYLNNTYYTILGSATRVEGWDFKVDYARTLEPIGRLKLGSTLAYTSFYAVGEASVLGMNRIGRDYLPRFKLQSSLAWFRAPWSAGLTHNYISAHGDLNRGSKIEYDPHSIYGATVSRSFRREFGGWFTGTRLMLGVDNLFDRDPSLYRSERGFWAPFARRPAGRFFYAEVKKTY